MRSHGIHLRALSLDDVKIPIDWTRLKIAVLKWHPSLPAANELTSLWVSQSRSHFTRGLWPDYQNLVQITRWAVLCNLWPGAHFTNDFSIIIQIRWKFPNALIQVVEQWSLWNFAWHNSCGVVACAKFCSGMIPYSGVTLKQIFHWIWIMMEKSFVKWAPDCIPRILNCNKKEFQFWDHQLFVKFSQARHGILLIKSKRWQTFALQLYLTRTYTNQNVNVGSCSTHRCLLLL